MKTKKAKKNTRIISDKKELAVKDERAYEIFKVWKILPKTLLRSDEMTLEKLGIDEPVLQELRGITTQRAFAEKYGKNEDTLVYWGKKIEQGQSFKDMAKWFAKLTPNVMMAHYKAARLPNNSADRRLWYQVVNEWKEMMGIGIVAKIEHTISDARKKEIDDLFEKNPRLSRE